MQSTHFPDHCVYCHKDTGLLLTVGRAGAKAHQECRRSRACGLCGQAGMTNLCAQPDCFRTVHPWCPQLFITTARTQSCEIHIFGKKRERFSHIKHTLARVPFNPPLVHSLRRLDKSTRNQSASCCTGHVFWYLINSQHFPASINLGVFPDFRQGAVSSEEALDILEDWTVAGCGSLDAVFEDVVVRLSRYRDMIETLKADLRENIKNAESENALHIKRLVQKTHTRRIKEQSQEERFLLCDLRLLYLRPVYEDYFKFIEAKQRSGSADLLQFTTMGSSLSIRVAKVPKCEEEFACAVCSDGDYEDDNLIVICAVSDK